MWWHCSCVIEPRRATLLGKWVCVTVCVYEFTENHSESRDSIHLQDVHVETDWLTTCTAAAERRSVKIPISQWIITYPLTPTLIFNISHNGVIRSAYLILDCRDWLLVAADIRHPGCSARISKTMPPLLTAAPLLDLGQLFRIRSIKQQQGRKAEGKHAHVLPTPKPQPPPPVCQHSTSTAKLCCNRLWLLGRRVVSAYF